MPIQASTIQYPNEMADKIIQLLMEYRRGIFSEEDKHDHHLDCVAVHFKKIVCQIKAGKPILFVLPAFPAKSPNADKTASRLPDLGERLALQFLDDLCQKIQLFYPPGALVMICSDGRVFNDLVRVSDAEVDAYAEGIRHILREDSLMRIMTFALDDYYGAMPYASMREKLVEDYGESVTLIKAKVKIDQAANQLFNGIHRFIYEDQLSIYLSLSKNQIKILTKKIAYHVIQRSNAWSCFVEKQFPDAVRLSIHPQLCGSEKLGIMLLKSRDVWATPWHRVVLYDGKEHKLVRKAEAEQMGATPVFAKEQFSHYVLGDMES